MAKNKFLLVSLKEDQAKQLAQVISNQTCRQILDYLAEKDATETLIATELNLPLSTVHYNLQQLVKGGLVVSEEFHYSEKGREVSHYKLANQYIIIAPKSTYGLKEKLKSILPVALVGVAITGIIHFFSQKNIMIGSSEIAVSKNLVQSVPLMDQAAQKVTAAASEAAPTLAAEPIQRAAEYIPVHEPNIALWFLFGTIFALIFYLAVDFFLNRKK